MSAVGAIRAARGLMRHGWAVFPVTWPVQRADGSVGCSCGECDCPSPAKHPRLKHGCLAASTNPADAARWLARWPLANLGVACGERSGIDVLDVDAGKGGPESLRALSERYALPETLRARTGGGGMHLYFRHAPGMTNSVNRVAAGIDVRSEGGYVLVPPSGHLAGAYQWLNPGTPIAPWPAWLREKAVLPFVGMPDVQHGESSGIPLGLCLFARRGVSQGSRNSAAFWLACRLHQECGDTADGRALLEEFGACCQPALGRAELDHVWAMARRKQAYEPSVITRREVDPRTGEVRTRRGAAPMAHVRRRGRREVGSRGAV